MSNQIVKEVFSLLTTVSIFAATPHINGVSLENFVSGNNHIISTMKNENKQQHQEIRSDVNDFIKTINPNELDKVIRVLDLAIPLTHRFIDVIEDEDLFVLKLKKLKELTEKSKELVEMFDILGNITELKSLKPVQEKLFKIHEQLNLFYYYLKLNYITSSRLGEIGHTFEVGTTINDVREVIG